MIRDLFDEGGFEGGFSKGASKGGFEGGLKPPSRSVLTLLVSRLKPPLGPDPTPLRRRGLREGGLLEAPFEAPSKGGGVRGGGGGKRETRRVKGGFSKGALRGTRRASHP